LPTELSIQKLDCSPQGNFGCCAFGQDVFGIQIRRVRLGGEQETYQCLRLGGQPLDKS
jgi:hypothetical protein